MARKKNFDESEILNSALELFWEKGYNATSIQDLVDRLGINRASIYDTWGDKHNLYLESLKKYRKQTSSWLLEQIRSDRSALNIIRELLMSTVHQSIEDQKQRGCFIVNSATELANQDNEVQQLYHDNQQTMEKVLNELIKEGQESGEIAQNHSSQSLSRFIFNTLTGLRVMAKGRFSEKELNEIVEVSLSALD